MRAKNRRDIEEEQYEFIYMIRTLREYNPCKYRIFLDTLETLRADKSIKDNIVDDWILARIEVEADR